MLDLCLRDATEGNFEFAVALLTTAVKKVCTEEQFFMSHTAALLSRGVTLLLPLRKSD
tara:strand:- start:200 stop:373 length:174 start_codon:yes stop_codon:yes gene_type:complete